MCKLFDITNKMILNPKLAQIIGLNESIVLQQMHYWLGKSSHEKEGKLWIYNTYNQWHEQFPFFCVSTIRRIIRNLENEGLVISSNFNKSKMDNTKWYTINYELLDSLYEEFEEMNCSSVEIEQRSGSNSVNEVSSLDKAIPETTTETNPNINQQQQSLCFKEVYDFFASSIRLPGAYELQRLRELCDEFKAGELIILAIKESLECNARNLRYIEKVLYSWKDKGINTYEQAKAYLRSYKKHKGDTVNGGYKGQGGEHKWNYRENKEHSEKWKGYRAAEPKLSGETNLEGLI